MPGEAVAKEQPTGESDHQGDGRHTDRNEKASVAGRKLVTLGFERVSHSLQHETDRQIDDAEAAERLISAAVWHGQLAQPFVGPGKPEDLPIRQQKTLGQQNRSGDIERKPCQEQIIE